MTTKDSDAAATVGSVLKSAASGIRILLPATRAATNAKDTRAASTQIRNGLWYLTSGIQRTERASVVELVDKDRAKISLTVMGSPRITYLVKPADQFCGPGLQYYYY